MNEFVHDIDEDDLEEYKTLITRQTQLEMELLQLQSYMEEKYLAGSEYAEGDCYIDWMTGAIYMWR